MSRVAGPVRPWRCKSFIDRCGLTFIATPNDRTIVLKINPHQPPPYNEGCGRIGLQPARAVAKSALAASIAIVPIAD